MLNLCGRNSLGCCPKPEVFSSQPVEISRSDEWSCPAAAADDNGTSDGKGLMGRAAGGEDHIVIAQSDSGAALELPKLTPTRSSDSPTRWQACRMASTSSEGSR